MTCNSKNPKFEIDHYHPKRDELQQDINEGKSTSAKLKTIPWWVWVLCVNGFFITATIAFPHLREVARQSIVIRVLERLTLSSEMNVATWWAGVCLLVVGLLSYELGSEEGERKWLLSAVVFVALSFDETGSIHERAMWHIGWTEISILLLLCLLCLLPVIWSLLCLKCTRSSAISLLLGFLLIVSAAPQEYFEVHVGVPSWLAGVRAGIEEGSELMGTFLCLFAVVRERQRRSRLANVLSAIPNPLLMCHIKLVLIGITLGQIPVALWSVNLDDFGRRGDPAVYVPMAVFFTLLLACMWFAHEGTSLEGRTWRRLVPLMLAASLMSFLFLSPHSLKSFHKEAQLCVLWTLLIIIAALAVGAVKASLMRKIPLVVLVSIIILVTIFFDRDLLNYIAASIISLLLAFVVLDTSIPRSGTSRANDCSRGEHHSTEAVRAQ
jgi:hypothetical protein